VIAWVVGSAFDQGSVDKILVARLDATLHITGPVRGIRNLIPGESVEEVDPSLAPDPSGNGFILAWMERPPKSQGFGRAVYCRLDSDLKPSTPSFLQDFTDLAAQAIVRSGKTTWITAGTSAWQVQADGSVKDPLYTGMYANDMVIATDFPQIVAGHKVKSGTTCASDGRTDVEEGSAVSAQLCRGGFVQLYTYFLQFVSLYTVSASRTFSFESDVAPAIQSDGRDVMIAWFRGTQMKGGDVVAMRLQPPAFASFNQTVEEPRILATFAPDFGLTRPDIAADGERYVVVWRTIGTPGEHDIVGASIDRAGNVIPLSIATTIADDRDPSVIALGGGRFLVVYEKLNGSDRRIAGRFVTFENRSRAVR